MDNFYLILMYLAIGFGLRHTSFLPENAASTLNAYALYVAFPAVILMAVPGLALSTELLIPAITPWILLLMVVVTILLLSRWLNWSKDVTGALLVIIPLGNTSFLGLPMVDAFFGHEFIPYALVYDQMGSFLALTLYATVVAAIYSPLMKTPSTGALLRKIFTFPSFIALILGLILGHLNISLPTLTDELISNLAATLVPVVMIAVGLQLSFRFERSEISPLMYGLGMKLLAMPLLVWAACLALGLQGNAVDITIFQAAMPSMISAGAIASMAGLAPRLVSGVVGLGILLSLATLPLLHSFLV
ncbi:AEC family transporter [Pseudomaricurvus sp.]|uniref:AEC family transporter n=1 Tax=Pseudomaricurvus sp. TaxID=2004510 RepID=UPI003F6D387A